MHASSAGRYIIGGSRNEVLVVRDTKPEDSTTYACEAQHTLTGDKRRSATAMVVVSRKIPFCQH